MSIFRKLKFTVGVSFLLKKILMLYNHVGGLSFVEAN